MNPLDVLRTLRASGAIVVLRPDDTIQCRAPTDVLTEDLVTAMRQHKEALLTVLEWYEERAGLLEYDGGMTRDAAEREAWKQVEERYAVMYQPRDSRRPGRP
jgi:predicted metal-dependent hydrolase